MKKIMIISALVSSLFMSTTLSFASNLPHGHKYYAKHAKHHKAHKVHRLHGLIDASYQN